MQRQLKFALPRRARRGRPRLPASKRKRWNARRPEFDGDNYPLHVTLKLRGGLPKLRGKRVLKHIRRAMQRSRGYGLNLIHYSILHNHLHLIIESSGKRRLTSQMKSLAITIARNLNPLWGRSGSLFEERYHARILVGPRRTRNALAYVLTNQWKHEGRGGMIRLDSYSTAILFDAWKAILGKDWRKHLQAPKPLTIEEYERRFEILETTDLPWTWLLREGWLKGA